MTDQDLKRIAPTCVACREREAAAIVDDEELCGSCALAAIESGHDRGELTELEKSIALVPVEYCCRVCESVKTVYVSPAIVHDEHTVEVHTRGRNRLVSVQCLECDREDRTHVAVRALSGGDQA